MRSTTRFHKDESRGLAGHEGQQLPPRHGGVCFERALRRHYTDLKHVFGEVDANDRLLGHGGLLLVYRSALLWSIIPERGVHNIGLWGEDMPWSSGPDEI